MKLGRNDPCSCGSGKKYKNCCLGKDQATPQTTLALKPKAEELRLLDTLFGAGRHAELENQARSLLARHPDAGLAWKLLALSLQMQGKPALNEMRKAAEFLPSDAEAHANLAAALRAHGLLDEAVASGRRALKLKPNFPEALNNLGVVLQSIGQPDEAVASYRRALKIKPDFAQAHNNLGSALKDLGRLEEGLASYRRAIEIKPDFAEAYSNAGTILKDLGRIDEAIANLRRALELNPDNAEARSNLLFVLNFTGARPSPDVLEQARQYGEVVTRKVTSCFSAWHCERQPERLRVGIVSGDLYAHPVAFFLENILSALDYSRIELIAYPTYYREDELTDRIRRHFSAWVPLSGRNDEAAARMIHADGVHVLVDLSGHTAHNRLPVFAWKPAPVQVSWLGYFATTGVAEIDYLLADETGVPEALRGQFTETIWYLPDTRLCFTAPSADIAVAPLPALSRGAVTFGCFQNLPKVSDEVLATWSRILEALPDARLRLQCKQLGEPAQREQLAQRLQRQGIAPERVAMHGGTDRNGYLAAHANVDMILDTFPYPGGTTTCEALWMGVPTLTLAGDSLLARQGASLLTAAGLGAWVAQSRDEYVSRAIALSGDWAGLAALRAGLRKQVLASPLFDAPRFAKNLENALWGIWQTGSPI